MRRTAAVAAAVVLAALAGCAGEGELEPTTADSGVPLLLAEAGHVHGMGLNPADGALYLGTHAGLLRVDDDGVRRVGRATTDLMGFSVVGPDRFVASGHPGPGEDLPEPVGLIESTDGGETWRQRSRGGQSDFHALTANRDVVVGFDGALLRTDDGTSWTPLAEDVVPASLAVSPHDGSLVVATTEHGPVRSTDGGATFAHVEGAPLLVLLAWPSPDRLWAVAPDGGVHLSTDGGATWAQTGTAGGPPQAFTASRQDTVVVALADRVVRSDDGGATFAVVVERE